MATITTKFNVGDKACTIDAKTMKIREFEIGWISAFMSQEKTVCISYRAKGDTVLDTSYDEDKCFATKHELLDYIEHPNEAK